MAPRAPRLARGRAAWIAGLTLSTLSTLTACAPRAVRFETRDAPPPRSSPLDAERDELAERAGGDAEPHAGWTLPPDRQRTLETVRRFLRRLEEEREPELELVTPDARLVARTSGQARPLRSALLERNASSSSAGAPPRLRFQLDTLVLEAEPTGSSPAEPAERADAPGGRPARVRVTLPPGSSGGSRSWWIDVSVTNHGLAVSEVTTADGTLR